ncbi:type II toxin-antitoxin system VapC family toxin [Membranihabitans maritimus]|uniref:type II toxin-antitoxin system VapC family toxin n=1 Tax=Membranihabitans maritimus TaxID=2904244 RepID=UPI001F308962|nr:PIN domain-containing protein [Membranihabitans maritimus]
MNKTVFLDANVLIYYLDESSDRQGDVVEKLQFLIGESSELYTSHHVIEEVLHIIFKLTGDKSLLRKAVRQIETIPNIRLIEPPLNFDFATKYADLFTSSKVGINDTLLIQLMVEGKISSLFTYDKKMQREISSLEIEVIP